MKGVVLAAGMGTRLFPLTDPLSKEMLPVYDKPMIVCAIEALFGAGILEVGIIVNQSAASLYRRMMLRHKWKGKLKFFVEKTKKRVGPARCLLLAEKWLGRKDFAVILGDSLFFRPLPRITRLSAPRLFVMEIGATENDLEKYSQVKLSGEHVSGFSEKPERVFSNIIQTGLFLFTADIFDRTRTFRRKGEVRMSDLTAQYVAEGRMKYTLLPPGSFLDCGTIEALFQASSRVRTQRIQGS